MIIASFDCAIKNMGVCYLEFDENFISKLKTCMPINVENVREVRGIIDNIFNIKHINVYNLVSEYKNANKTPAYVRTSRLKSLLNNLDEQMPTPDVVLIEYQMGPNHISGSISNQIVYHFSKEDNKIISSIKEQNIDFKEPPAIKYDVHIIGTSLKNSVSTHPDGLYSNFISRYSNYTANKKHTTWNFKNFCHIMEYQHIIDSVPKNVKMDDIADSFMAIMGWIKKNTKKIIK